MFSFAPSQESFSLTSSARAPSCRSVPGDCLDAFPVVLAYLERMAEVPAIKEWYAAH